MVLTVALTVVFSGCGEHRSVRPTAAAPAHKHEHVAPHGGTAVELGRDEFHLELVADLVAGRLTAYLLDGELEQFIRVPAPAFQVIAIVGGAERTLTFNAVSNPATGEMAGDTSQFEATAGWLKATTNFDATLKELTIRGKAYRDVTFNFPKGNE